MSSEEGGQSGRRGGGRGGGFLPKARRAASTPSEADAEEVGHPVHDVQQVASVRLRHLLHTNLQHKETRDREAKEEGNAGIVHAHAEEVKEDGDEGKENVHCLSNELVVEQKICCLFDELSETPSAGYKDNLLHLVAQLGSTLNEAKEQLQMFTSPNALHCFTETELRSFDTLVGVARSWYNSIQAELGQLQDLQRPSFSANELELKTKSVKDEVQQISSKYEAKLKEQADNEAKVKAKEEATQARQEIAALAHTLNATLNEAEEQLQMFTSPDACHYFSEAELHSFDELVANARLLYNDIQAELGQLQDLQRPSFSVNELEQQTKCVKDGLQQMSTKYDEAKLKEQADNEARVQAEEAKKEALARQEIESLANVLNATLNEAEEQLQMFNSPEARHFFTETELHSFGTLVGVVHPWYNSIQTELGRLQTIKKASFTKNDLEQQTKSVKEVLQQMSTKYETKLKEQADNEARIQAEEAKKEALARQEIESLANVLNATLNEAEEQLQMFNSPEARHFFTAIELTVAGTLVNFARLWYNNIHTELGRLQTIKKASFTKNDLEQQTKSVEDAIGRLTKQYAKLKKEANEVNVQADGGQQAAKEENEVIKEGSGTTNGLGLIVDNANQQDGGAVAQPAQQQQGGGAVAQPAQQQQGGGAVAQPAQQQQGGGAVAQQRHGGGQQRVPEDPKGREKLDFYPTSEMRDSDYNRLSDMFEEHLRARKRFTIVIHHLPTVFVESGKAEIRKNLVDAVKYYCNDRYAQHFNRSVEEIRYKAIQSTDDDPFVSFVHLALRFGTPKEEAIWIANFFERPEILVVCPPFPELVDVRGDAAHRAMGDVDHSDGQDGNGNNNN